MIRRIKSRVLVTAILIAPIAAVALIVVWIFVFLGSAGERAMVEPAVGAGAGDTGGANALGELLLGRDPDDIASRNRAIRQGTAIDPGELDRPFVFAARLDGSPRLVEVEFVLDRAPYRRAELEPAAETGVWSRTFEPRDVPTGAFYRLIIDAEPTEPAPVPLMPAELAAADLPVVRVDHRPVRSPAE